MNTVASEHKFLILDQFEWSPWTEQWTRSGKRIIRRTVIEKNQLGEKFWSLWRENGGKLKGEGYSVRKNEFDWELSQWRMPDGTETPEQNIFKEKEEEQKRAENWAPEDIIVPEDIKSKLLDYQPDSVKRIVHAIRKYGCALDGSDMGTGKSYVGAAAAMILGLKPAIICPIAVIAPWKRVLNHFGLSSPMIINYESLRTGNTPYGGWVKKSRGAEVFEYNLPKDTLLIFDEIQKCKNPKSKNCKLGIGAIRQELKILGCSGTIASNPMEMRFSGQLAKLHNGLDFYAWMHRNGVVKESWGLSYRGGQSVLHKIRQQIYPEHGTRLRKDDLPGFPECSIQAEAYDCGEITKDISNVYDSMRTKIAEIEVDLTKTASQRLASTMAEQTAARMEAEKLKIPAIVNLAKEYVEDGNSVVIFTNYRESLAIVCDLLKTKCCVQGCQSPKEMKERQENIDAFQEDKERIIVVNIQSGGAGIGLHDIRGEFPRVSIICPSWSCFDMSQATGRIHRAGAKSKAVQKVFFAAGTIEEDVCNRVREKLKNMKALNDGERFEMEGIF